MTGFQAHGRSQAQHPFVLDVSSAISDLRQSLMDLIRAIPNADGGIDKAFDLQRALKLDSKLAWRVFKIATLDDPLESSALVPKRVSMSRLFKVATDHEVPSHIVQRAAGAFDRFERIVDDYAGERQVFETLVTGFTSEAGRRLELDHRRAAFRAQSHLLGLLAKTQLSCWIAHPGDQPGTCNMASLQGFVDLQRLRPDVRLVITRLHYAEDHGSVVEGRSGPWEPLDSRSDEHGIGLLSNFSDPPSPELRVTTDSWNSSDVEIVSDSIGLKSAITCFTGTRSRFGSSVYRTDTLGEGITGARVRVPCEVLIRDFLVYDGMFGPIVPRLKVLTDHQNQDPVIAHRPHDQLPSTEEIRYLGRGLDRAHTADVPRYAEMLQSAIDRLGLSADKFDVYRVRMEYPLLPSTVAIEFSLPDRPA